MRLHRPSQGVAHSECPDDGFYNWLSGRAGDSAGDDSWFLAGYYNFDEVARPAYTGGADVVVCFVRREIHIEQAQDKNRVGTGRAGLERKGALIAGLARRSRFEGVADRSRARDPALHSLGRVGGGGVETADLELSRRRAVVRRLLAVGVLEDEPIFQGADLLPLEIVE